MAREYGYTVRTYEGQVPSDLDVSPYVRQLVAPPRNTSGGVRRAFIEDAVWVG